MMISRLIINIIMIIIIHYTLYVIYIIQRLNSALVHESSISADEELDL